MLKVSVSDSEVLLYFGTEHPAALDFCLGLDTSRHDGSGLAFKNW
jgi:hypothetical protein